MAQWNINGDYEPREDDFVYDPMDSDHTYARAYDFETTSTTEAYLPPSYECLICGEVEGPLFISFLGDPESDHDHSAVIFKDGLPVTDILWRVVGKHAPMYQAINDGLENSTAVVMGVPTPGAIKWHTDTYDDLRGSTISITYTTII